VELPTTDMPMFIGPVRCKFVSPPRRSQNRQGHRQLRDDLIVRAATPNRPGVFSAWQIMREETAEARLNDRVHFVRPQRCAIAALVARRHLTVLDSAGAADASARPPRLLAALRHRGGG
jgi:hypothetical protein